MQMRRVPLLTIVASILLALVGCAHSPALPPQCPSPPPPTPEMLVPAPPPGIFSQCLRAILELKEGEQINDTCWSFLEPAEIK